MYRYDQIDRDMLADRTAEFRAKYRNIDLLLEAVELLAGRVAQRLGVRVLGVEADRFGRRPGSRSED